MSDPIKQSLLKAQKCIDDKEYSNALSHFDYVLRRVKTGQTHLDVLDQRASTCIRIRRFHDAYQDAKNMIRDHSKDARGFLRTVQVLRYQARENDDDAYLRRALKVAKSGIAHADEDADSPRYKQLVRIADELTVQCAVKRLDPVNALPLELFIGIFESLSVLDRLTCRRVSRDWNRVISKTPQLWKKFSFRSTRRRGQVWNASGIQAGLRLATDGAGTCHVTELAINFSDGENAPLLGKEQQLLISVLKQTTRLQSMRINKWVARLDGDSLASPWKQGTCPNLRVLAIDALEPESRRSGESRLDALLAWLAGMLHNVPNLECLQLSVQDWWDEDVPGNGRMIWPQTSSKLKILQLRTSSGSDTAAPTLNLDQLALSAPQLEELDIFPGSLAFVDNPPESKVYCRFGNLKRLRLVCNPDNILPALPPTLEHLRLDENDDSDAFDTLTCQHFDRPLIPHLKSLEMNLRECPDGLISLLEASECKLTALAIQNETLCGLMDNYSNDTDPIWLIRQLYKAGILSNLGQLTLRLNFANTIRDSDATSIATMIPSLRNVIFGGETRLTGVGMHALATKLKDLRLLDVGKSPSANVDVIAFFRSRGITLRGKIGLELTEVGQGRKLRFE